MIQHVKLADFIAPLSGSATTLLMINWTDVYQAALLGLIGGIFGYIGRLTVRFIYQVIKAKLKTKNKNEKSVDRT